ncbi:hypothetical protein ABLV94_07275 [Staphylococcus sp. Mo2-7]
MDNEKFRAGLGKSFDHTKKPKALGAFFESASHIEPSSETMKEKMKPANHSTLMSTPEPVIFDRISELREHLNETYYIEMADKAETKQLQIKQTQYLKSIAENMDFIANQFKMTSTALITLNATMDKMGVTFSDIQKDVEENKAINAEIFEVLEKTRISNEEERLKATESLLTKINDKAKLAEIPTNIISLINFIMQFYK